jgi:hypothetical protein
MVAALCALLNQAAFWILLRQMFAVTRTSALKGSTIAQAAPFARILATAVGGSAIAS